MKAKPPSDSPAPPPLGAARSGRVLRLRTVVLLLLLSAGIYAAGLSVYLVLSVGSAARALGEGTESFVALLQDQQRRAEALHGATDLGATALASRAPPGPILDSLRKLATVGSVSSRAQPFASVTTRQRGLLARSDEEMSSLASALIELGALLELERWEEASNRQRIAHAMSDRVTARVSAANGERSADLLRRQEALQRASDRAWRVALIWLAVGAGLIPLALAVIRRRIWRPLAELEAGLARVSEGELAAQVPVARADEIGRVTQHFNDMTRVLRERAEEQGRFAAAGELLAGVAHEVNNPLMAIAVHAESRLAEPGRDASLHEEMGLILRQARRASKLLRGLLRFVRPHERQVSRLDLNEIVLGAVDLVSYRFGVDEIELGGTLDPKLPSVLGDAIGLEQVMVNLLSNAIDALRTVPTPRRLTIDSWVEGGRVRVAVVDNGAGIPAHIASHLFKPFTTTKGTGGTGLGLYISRQIVQQAGGDLEVLSGPDEGARFVLSMPAVSEEPAARSEARLEPFPSDGPLQPTAPSRSPPSPRGAPPREGPLAGLRVLLVDDEDPIRRPVARFLARRGAEVFEAVDGRDALERLNEQVVDLVVADLRMPRMSGVQLHAHLRVTHPLLAARMLVVTGDISQLAEPGAVPIPPDRVLDKPVQLEELERRILMMVGAAHPLGHP